MTVGKRLDEIEDRAGDLWAQAVADVAGRVRACFDTATADLAPEVAEAVRVRFADELRGATI